MSATSFLRRACFPPSIFTRTFCQAHINRSPLAKHAIVKPYVAGIRIHLNRHSSVVPARAILSVSDAPRPPSILKLIPSRIWNATHRDGGTSFAAKYGYKPQPPKPRGPWAWFRAAVNAIPYKVILWGILAINGIVFTLWQSARADAMKGNIRSYQWMVDNFTASGHNIQAGRWWTVLTCAFSHEESAHMLFNCLTYYFMAPPVLLALGNFGFLGLYLGGALACSFTTLWWNYTMKGKTHVNSHGASGSINSVMTVLACAAPTMTFLIFAVIPVPAWLAVSGFFVYDAYMSVTGKETHVDTAGHVGGVLWGLTFFLAKRLRVF